MSTENLIKKLKEDEKAIFKGWNFSHIQSRFNQEEPHWDYFKLAKKLLKNSKSVLDMATGGGELFSKFAPFDIKAVAIEGYHPNVPIAKNLLEPLGVKVLEANEVEKLPFRDNEFDLILNRHGGINKKSIKEIYRVQSRYGLFLTQQVDGNKNKII
ncbi:MAG: class I SAM-dependent methyltransferase [Nanoarchaeota archaeon]